MSRYDYYDYFKSTRAIVTDEGIKARSQRGNFAKNWWAVRWIKSLERLVDSGRLSRGRTYARKGQVLGIEESKDGIRAQVQGSRRKPYKVRIELTNLSDAQWERVIDALSEQAIFAAQLLAGEMPQDIELVFETAGVSLFPSRQDELMTECSCPDWANPCKHVAAVHYILGELFDEDPFLLFRLRGRTQEQILESLRARRADSADTEDDESEAEQEEEPFVPLTTSIADFWELGQPLNPFTTSIKPPAAELSLLKRLGQPSFLDDDVLKTLGPAYRAITQTAIAAAFQDRGQDGNEDV
jgi:uncharacterized Zn finger protein